MNSLTTSQNPNTGFSAGTAAGLMGGLFFGVMMGRLGMLPIAGMLVGIENAVIGFFVHMIISAFIGAVYGLVATRLPQNTAVTAAAGIANSIIWWVLGTLILKPLLLGMTNMVFVAGSMQWSSLLGHIIFGLITAFAFIPLSKWF